ncbi:MAG TPA: DUF4870 domain-containing protein [Candidatus Nanoarchaeia archaeon]|nr:DUF4870 domain-containing protein [Candidatus Nanoarchaeia archaeon]
MAEENQTPHNPSAPMSADDRDALDNKYTALFSYVNILFLVPLLLRRDSKFCQFHAKQGLVLFVMEFILSIFGWFMWIPPIGMLLILATFIICIIGILKVLSGEYWKIPYIYGWSEKIKI